LFLPRLGGYRLVVVSKIMSSKFDCAATTQSAGESLQHYTQQAVLLVLYISVQVDVSSVADGKHFDARYVRDPQSSETEVLGTANIDLWQTTLIIG
jgi:hypothetical protein